ncbi:MAG: DUF2333 family protein [Desulfobacteraceae bacterium]|nr:DUF2333 family protein [Desulfobacteraceae bacterium]
MDNANQDIEKDKEYKKYALIRLVVAGALLIALVWALTAGLSYFDFPSKAHAPKSDSKPEIISRTEDIYQQGQQKSALPEKPTKSPAGTTSKQGLAAEGSDRADRSSTYETKNTRHGEKTVEHAPSKKGKSDKKSIAKDASKKPTTAHPSNPKGVAFVTAVIKPLEYELKHRFWGWRPNDIFNITDNINSFQLGVLEVTRRTAVQLNEMISRTGSTASFDPNLENAMNWFMIKSNQYWFPSPESKYLQSLNELEKYKKKLKNKTAFFYTRVDNLIPLLMAYENLLGSCDENLIKETENDGKKVSFFKTDNYFYYAKGVANTIATILEAIHHDFDITLKGRVATELLHHALKSCKRAAKLNPWFITNASLDGALANHRANIAAPISHARFYISQLIKTLST